MKRIIFSLLSALLIISCSEKTVDDLIEGSRVVSLGDPELFGWVKSHSYGTLDPQGIIEFKLGEKAIQFFKDEDIPTGVLKRCPLILSPNIPGECQFQSDKVLYIPTSSFETGTLYDIAIDLSYFKEFTNTYLKWQQRVPDRHFQVHFEPLIAWSDGRGFRLKGSVQTSILFEREIIEKGLSLAAPHPVNIKWLETDSIAKDFQFELTQLPAKAEAYDLVFTMDADHFDREEDWVHTTSIPHLKRFDIIDSRWVSGANPYVLLSFTKPLDSKQSLQGLITHSSIENIIKDGSQVKIYTSSRHRSGFTLRLSKNIRDINGNSLSAKKVIQVNKTAEKPSLKILGKGNVLPSRGEKARIYFEAQALKQIRFRVLQINDVNMVQYLQVNQLSGMKEMNRTGETIMDTLVTLQSLKSHGGLKYGLDVDSLMRNSKGSMLHYEISFDPSMIDYSCADSSFIEDYQLPAEGAEQSFWDYSGYGYWWENEDNPCHPAYYDNHTIKVSKNVIASDLGIIAKTSDKKKLWVSVRNLLNAEPETGIWVRVKNFQGRTLVEAKTNSDGFVEFDSQDEAFVVEAQKKDDRNFLKLRTHHQLSISDFDVQGSQASSGIQVYQYGERGVWRPGDTLYLTAILHDPQKELPPALGVKMDLRNPQGNRVHHTVIRESLNGFYHWKVVTDPQAATGTYSWNLRVAGQVFKKNIKIASIKPNRLKVAMTFSDSTEKVVQTGDHVTISSRYLHGASAGGLKARLYLTTSPQSTVITQSSAYHFDDMVRTYSGDKSLLWSGSLDHNGQQDLELTFDKFEGAPGQLKAFFEAEVSESGGQSVRYESKVLNPYDTYIGLKLPPGDRARNMLLTDKDHQIEVVARTPQGKSIKATQVEMKFYKLSWKWWWHKQDDLNFLNSSSTRLLNEEIIEVDGKANWKIHVKYPDWGRYLVRACDLDGGHCSSKIVYVDWPGWAGRAQSGEVSGPQILAFSTDRKKYKIGDIVKVKVPSSHQGYFWVSLENGSRVVSHFWKKASRGENEIEIKIPEGSSPNAYVSVVLIQPADGRKNDLPVRLYGVTPIDIEDSSTLLQPILEHKKVFKPNSSVQLNVSEKNGQAMTYTVAMVDEGLLDLTNFKTPNAHKEFYKKQTLAIRTYDLYDDIIGVYEGNLDHLLAVGGGGSNRGRKSVKRFRPMVRYLGPFHIQAGESKVHDVIMPSYVGSVRMMVVAGDRRAKVFGSTESTAPVRQDIMIQGTLPRVLGPNEEVSMALQVFNMSDKPKSVNWNLTEFPELTSLAQTKGKIKLGAKQDTIIRVPLKVKSVLKGTHVSFEARSGRDISQDKIDFEIRTPTTKIRESQSQVLKPGEILEVKGDLEGFEEHQKVTLNVSQGEPLYIEDHLQRLVQYPHGCVEQTTSKAFPQLFLEDLVDLTPSEKIRVDEHINAAIAKLEKYQTPQGLLSYWPGQNQPAEWASIYVAHFMTEAKKRGYVVNDQFYNKLLNALKKKANRWRTPVSNTYRNHDMREQSYRLYVLSLAKQVPMSALNRLYESRKLDGELSWLVAAAYFNKGRQDMASKILEDKQSDLIFDDQYDGHSYGSNLRDQSMLLNLASQMGDEETAFKYGSALSKRISNTRYLSTHEASWSLMALASWQKKFIQGKSLNIKLDQQSIVSKKPTIKKILQIKDGSYHSQIKNLGEGVLFVQWVKEYHPIEETSHSKGLRLAERYSALEGTPLDYKKLKSGDDVILKLEVSNTSGKNLENIALTKMIPSGWEFLEIPQENKGVDYQDVRDAKAHYYFDLKKGQSITIKIPIKASYVGRYFMSGASVESMYQMDIRSKVKGEWVVVTQ